MFVLILMIITGMLFRHHLFFNECSDISVLHIISSVSVALPFSLVIHLSREIEWPASKLTNYSSRRAFVDEK